jgi:ADP-ribose pyrophosphatase YjhB (NUDIX family)
LSLHLVVARQGQLDSDPAGAGQFLANIRNFGGRVLLLEADGTSARLQARLAAENLLPDETIFLASLPEDAALAKSLRLKVGSLRIHAADTAPDEIWQDLADAARWVERQGQLTKRAWPIATVGGLVFAPDGTALFVRTAKWGGTWGVPGGKIDYGETHESAFLREILEETGLRAFSPEIVLVQDAIEEPEFFRPRHFLLLNYKAFCASKEVSLNHESLEHGWFELRESLSLKLNRPTRALVEHLLGKPGDRTSTG